MSLSLGGGGRLDNAGIAALLALGVLYLGLLGVWGFLERAGADAGMAPSLVGAALSGALFVGGIGALFVAVIGQRLGTILPLGVATLLILAAMAALALPANPWWFAAGALVFNVGWNLATPFQYGLVAAADPSGRLVVLIPAVQTFCSVVGAGLAGYIVGVASHGGLYAFMGICALVSFGIFAWAAVRQRRSTPA